ncbi:hypothetical protein ECANGB1_2186 [Enterospora canceri]|uniref:BAP29/BAP31 transmembrane domain-containing protein n=1 Tax=Enterospora canceri TaxID=1081671 RepID=A0A1Y1S623_9MICR|nr:hypothetical protein ECANGB1_2186 [Enterospora canceri]
MEIQIAVIHGIMGINILLNLFLLFPWLDALKHWFLRVYSNSIAFKAISHVLNVLYVMVVIVLFDSIYKLSITDNKILEFQSQRNMYLSGFVLFLAFNLSRLVKIIHVRFAVSKDYKYVLKQHKNAEIFLKTIAEKYEEEQKKNKNYREEVERLKKCLNRYKDEIGQIEANRKSYLTLKDKYDALLSKTLRESKKSK